MISYGYSAKEIKEDLAAENDEIIFHDEFDEALIGYSEGINTCAVYDRFHCIHILMENEGMSEEDAEDYFQYNYIGFHQGGNSPIFLVNLRD